MNHLLLFDSYHTPRHSGDIAEILKDLIHGSELRGHDIDTIEDRFRYAIPDALKYTGTAYRAVFFEEEADYDACVKTGMVNDRRVYFSCTKDEACIPGVVMSLGAGYAYYVVFEVRSTSESCLFDVNAMCEHFGVDSVYGHEQEVLIYSDRVGALPPDAVVEHGLTEDYS